MSNRGTNGRDHGRGLRVADRSRVATVALAAVVLVSTLAVAPAAAQDNGTFIVEQGSQCVQVTPVGDGSESVEAFYDYRSTVTTPEGLYSSYGTTDIQESETSQVFVYRGSEGLSLVFLHGAFGDAGGGFAVTADVSGLPTDGEWAVEDDTYNNRDDAFEHSNESSHIEWVSNGNRTDGAAFRGLGRPGYATITADVQFNEDSNRYPFEEWNGPPEQNRIERWVVRSGTGETTELDMSQPVEISPGTCNGGISTFTPTPDEPNTTGTTAPTERTTTTPTQTPTPTDTPTPTQTPTATPTSTDAPTPTPAATPAPTDTDTGGLVATTQRTTERDGSGVFGPGFGVPLAVAAVLALAAVALVRRSD